MKAVRLGAVDYLNARPLVYGLEMRSDLFTVRYDVPSKCAALLHEGSIDVGMIPSIEYLRGDAYRIVPGAGIISEGPVASVALFTTVPVQQVRTIAADTSSRTSNALLHVLCMERFGIDPEFRPMHPDAATMLRSCDAALLIGDPALFLDYKALGAAKVDLGEQWTAMTGLPFVWAFWAGRPSALTREGVDALLAARDAGIAASDAIATAYCGAERAARGRAYLRDNIRYSLGEREEAGLRMYYELAGKHGLVETVAPPAFYHQ
ncbi:MAG TPA: menaquinone biosynthesis protein [Vicinamibacterales bacterium]|jgi:chorismate dehydratase|nr:menaquinone biosynthesis protein [Vicinamibacterales bacterium]